MLAAMLARPLGPGLFCGHARERAQVIGLVGVQAQHPGQGIEHAIGGVAGQSLLQPRE
jgi:hypothetical protein